MAELLFVSILNLPDPAIESRFFFQIVVRPALNDAAAIEYEDLIGMHQCGETVCDHDRGVASSTALESLQDK